MREFQKIIQDDLDWLFHHYELDAVDIVKSIDSEREWDYVLKLRMGKIKDVFQGVRLNEDGTVDCVSPWTLTELMEVIRGLEVSE